MQWLSKCYDMVMEWLFNAVAVFSCAVLWLGSSCQLICMFSSGHDEGSYEERYGRYGGHGMVL